MASVNAFFAGRGESWPVLWVYVAGAVVTVVLDYVWIYGHWGFAESGIAGAGRATVCGAWASALVGIVLILRNRYRKEFETLAGWRFDRALFLRLMRFGIPSGLQYCLEALAFTIFLILVGQLGTTELTATSVAFTINTVVLVPMLGFGQAVSVLVGQRLGHNQPRLAAKSTIIGVAWCLLYTLIGAVVFAFFPGPVLALFEDHDAERWAAVLPIVPVLLKFVAVYCLFESVSLILSSALRGAGDTRFVSAVTLLFSWTIMVLPTIISRRSGWGLYSVWIFATSYIVVLSFVFMWRFRQGKWKNMRVIESAPAVI
jgi:MATE family multidrug resistance protein